TSILDRLDGDAYKEIEKLNTQLAKTHGTKKETLKKIHLLEASEHNTSKDLAQAEVRVKNLEEKYQTLLKN
ncbi:MAG: hypothetical protein IIA88_07415, partial [Bacteroidetes bacterium]|nr:hypothetical protein [Bacteroidota bacterium]